MTDERKFRLEQKTGKGASNNGKPETNGCHITKGHQMQGKMVGDPKVVVSTAFHARVRGSFPGLGGLKEAKRFLLHPLVKIRGEHP